MTTYDLVLGLCWFQSRNPALDWSKGQLLGWRTAVGNSWNEQTITSLPQGDGSAEHGACKPPPTIDIQFMGATTFDDLHASNELAAAFTIQINECIGLLGTWTMLEGVTSETLGETSPGQCWIWEQGAVVVVAAEGGPQGYPEWLLPARRDTTWVPGRRGLALLWRTVLIQPPGTPTFLQSCQNRVASRG